MRAGQPTAQHLRLAGDHAAEPPLTHLPAHQVALSPRQVVLDPVQGRVDVFDLVAAVHQVKPDGPRLTGADPQAKNPSEEGVDLTDLVTLGNFGDAGECVRHQQLLHY